jgi:DNA-binding Lrp family transcriptional regulator
MARRKPKYDNRIVLYVTSHGPTTQAVLAKSLKIPVASIYVIVKRLVKQGVVKMDGRLVCPVHVTAPVEKEDARLIAESNAKTADAVDRIAMLKNEIDNITDGIRSLVITRSYLMRRVQEENANI